MAKIKKKKTVKTKKRKSNVSAVSTKETSPKFSSTDEFIYSCFMGMKKAWKTFYSWWHPKKFSTKFLIVLSVIIVISGINLLNEISANDEIIYPNLIAYVNKQPYDKSAINNFIIYFGNIVISFFLILLVGIYKLISSLFNVIRYDYDPLKKSLKQARKQVKLKL